MNMRTILINAFIILTFLFASGCVSLQKAAPEKSVKAKQFISNSSLAQVYIYRNETFGAALFMPVTVDGKLAGKTRQKSFLKMGLPAGKHVSPCVRLVVASTKK
jgi:hypothetical protein